eukprot:TRINITY_DN23682_c0_g1_i3.p1 TRINITY_DN23682_c0_g1~~TRINITY_DN23682_c0_g1_i3.p1  ORF type:complete len:373 (+),score=105.19 TRINITY_DN23682_c0_g1_i3:148-1266(+)
MAVSGLPRHTNNKLRSLYRVCLVATLISLLGRSAFLWSSSFGPRLRGHCGSSMEAARIRLCGRQEGTRAGKHKHGLACIDEGTPEQEAKKAAEEGSEDGFAADRIAQIQAAIRRGEERAAKLAAGEELEASSEPRRLTTKEQDMLESLMVFPDAEKQTGSAEMFPGIRDLQPGLAAGAQPQIIDVSSEDSEGLERMRRTLEFCPDGKLAKEILRDMRLHDAKPPGVLAYNAVIEALTCRGALDDALEVLSDMKEGNVAPNADTYNRLALPASRSGEFRFVEALFRAKASDSGGGLGAESLTLLLDSYANALPRQPGKAEAAFRCEMGFAEEQGLTSDKAVSGPMMVALLRAVGTKAFEDLCNEYDLDPDAAW